MRHLRVHLRKSKLFKDYGDEDLYHLLQHLRYRVSTFAEGQTVALEGAPCSHLGIVLTGEVQVQKISESGNTLIVDRLPPGSTFGEVIIFSQQLQYPATITASDQETAIMFIAAGEIVNLCRTDPKFMERFLGLLSDKILMLNRKIEGMSRRTIRQKVAGFLLDEYRKQKRLHLDLDLTRKDMADHLGIPRPSLSRELGNMKDEGLIDFHRSTMKIHCIDALEACLLT